MSFVRSKSIKGHTYYYLVSNKRVNGRVVQKFEKYYGKNSPSPSTKVETVDASKQEQSQQQ
ncbi:MAG: hypothetical protein Q7R70_06195 [Candidatus Diapherotrites archaeon]|nr:hypothetical protein [Candidatus Diapherotrites archaeon]